MNERDPYVRQTGSAEAQRLATPGPESSMLDNRPVTPPTESDLMAIISSVASASERIYDIRRRMTNTADSAFGSAPEGNGQAAGEPSGNGLFGVIADHLRALHDNVTEMEAQAQRFDRMV